MCYSPSKLIGSGAIGTLVLLLVLSVSAPDAFAIGFALGDSANYAVIFQGGGNNQLNINNGPGLNGLAVNGNIGIDNTSPNNGKLQLSGPLLLNSNVDFAGAYTQGTQDNGPYSGNIQVNGTISGGHANVHTDMLYLNNLSTTLGGEAGTSVALNTGATINGASGVLDGFGNRVFTVSGINAPNGTLTVNGDGISKVVFNISAAADGNFHFNSVVLGGGLTSDDVLFNFFGGTAATLSGGPTLDINSNGDTLFGTFLDPYGTISDTHSVLNGRLFGGDTHNMQVVSGALINAPSVPDNGSTVMLLGLAFVGLGCVGGKFQVRQALSSA
jgi:hypothetical protein